MRKHTSLQIDSKLWQKVKAYCASNDVFIYDFTEKALKEKLNKCIKVKPQSQ